MILRVLVLLFLCLPASAGSFILFSDTMNLDLGSYRYLKFRVTPDQADSTRITGHYTTQPENTPVELILLTEWNYRTGWVNRGDIDTLAVHRGGTGAVSIPIPDYGDFVLVVSNRGNFSPVEFAADLQVAYSGTGITYDSLPMGMTILISVLAAALVAAAVALTVKKLN